MSCESNYVLQQGSSQYLCLQAVTDPNCLIQDENAKCVSCIPGYTPVAGVCFLWIDGYYINQTAQYTPCPVLDGCIFCLNSTSCKNCNNTLGYYLNASSQCHPCQSECTQCLQANLCTKCQIGYYLDNVLCQNCS